MWVVSYRRPLLPSEVLYRVPLCRLEREGFVEGVRRGANPETQVSTQKTKSPSVRETRMTLLGVT